MITVGLTGSIGMGKSTTAEMFAAQGAPVYDADAEVRRLYAAGGAAVPLVEKAFPGVTVDGAIDRSHLGARVLGDPQALARLNRIVWPLMGAARAGDQAVTSSGAATTSVSAQDLLARPVGANWTSYNGDYTGRRYSSLKEINTTNVAQLRPAWVFHPGNSQRLIATPVNLGSSESISIDGLVTMVEKIAGAKLTRTYDLTAPKGVAGRNSDNTFIREVLGWEPATLLSIGMARTYEWIERQSADRKAGRRVVQDCRAATA